MSLAEHTLEGALAARAPRPPNSSSILERPRLTALLESGSASALCIVRGSRSSGKSVALRQWAAATDRELLWLYAADDITSLDCFWTRLQAALDTRLAPAPRLQHNQDACGPGSTFPARQLATRLSGAEPFTLVIEDFHRVQRLGVETGLLELLEHAPLLNIVIAARSALDVEGRLVSSNADVHTVGPDCLLFSADEAASFHAGTALEPISRELNKRLDGSPALHSSARRVARESRQQTVDFTDDIVSKVATSLSRELGPKQLRFLDDATAGFIASTISLQHFDLALAQAVAPSCDVEATVLELLEAGFLWSRETSSAVHYGYPEVLGQIFESLLSKDIAAARLSALAAGADLEFSRGAYVPAFSYAIAAGDYPLASSMLVRSGLQLLFEGNSKFSAALRQIPHTRIAKHPLLALALGLVYNADKRTRLKGLEYFTLALASSKIQGRALPPEERLAMSLAQAVALRLTGQFKLAASTSRASLRDHAELSLADRDRLAIFESIALGHWGLTLILTGDFTVATTALNHAVSAGLTVATSGGSGQAVFFATSLLAYRYALDGDMSRAEDYAASALDALPDVPALELYQQTPLYMTLAMVELGRLQPEAAAVHLAKVISEATSSEFWGRLRIIEAQIDLLRGHPGVAFGRLDRVMATKKELPALNPLDTADLRVLTSKLHLAGGNASAAAAALGKHAGKDTGAKIAQARLSLAIGRPTDVVEALAAPLHHPTAVHTLDALVLLTAARLHLQPAPTLRADVERISGTAMALGNLWPLAMLSAMELELLTGAWLELGVPNPPSAATALMPVSLSMVTLTPREASILATLANTGDRSEIARIHFVSLNTIKTQLRSLYKKLGVSSREEALLVAHQEHLLN